MRIASHLIIVALLIACGSSGPGPVYSGDVLAGDVSMLLSTLEEAYGPKALIVPVAWQRTRRSVEALDVTSMDRRRFCDVIGSALTTYGDPGLFVTLEPEQDVSARCHAPDVDVRPQGVPSEGVVRGENIVGSDDLYEVRQQGSDQSRSSLRRS